MLTGYNSDVEHEGRQFHVQTEDKGKDNPVIETLIYRGGQIIANLRTSYGEGNSEPLTGQRLHEMIERQHKTIVKDIRLGKYDSPEERRPFGHGIITSRSLDDIVQEFMQEAEAKGLLPDPPPGRSRSRP